MPTLATVLQTIASTDLHVLLDIKDCPDSVKRDALALVERMALAERVILGPRTLADLGEFTAIDRGLRTLALVPGRTDLPPDFSEIDAFVRGGADMVRLWPSWILTDDDSGAELVARVHRRGKSVWTCADTLYGDISADDPVSDFRRLVGIGVAGIMTNLPSVLQPIVADVS
ncbi:Glycerophosphoryl diester phosphodiesterase OS=Tsukamurella paurometabola (strain ATCC 8368 / DSM / CCUG 35730 / CIP 100753 / JCM 10117 / KCTC 9821 / NBRC 16120 / NCIMB 702349 / NCTC 13040) OX=521096 GN=Tpau_3036 PE=4 SV=1 [Tsukamurella paurometabola]|nr:Uncharacterised protein [Tsukamurella paurometabola]